MYACCFGIETVRLIQIVTKIVHRPDHLSKYYMLYGLVIVMNQSLPSASDVKTCF